MGFCVRQEGFVELVEWVYFLLSAYNLQGKKFSS